MDPDEAAKLYLRRIEMKIPVFETMNENELNYVKMINAGQGFFYNNVSFNVSMPASSDYTDKQYQNGPLISCGMPLVSY